MEDYGGEGFGCCAAEEGALSVLLKMKEITSSELEKSRTIQRVSSRIIPRRVER